MFPHKSIYKNTWKSADGITINQIDHVVIDSRHKNCITDVRSFRGADCDSDHYMLGIKIRARIDTCKKEPRLQKHQIDLENLKDKETCHSFQIELRNKFDTLEKLGSIDQEWKILKETVQDVAFKTLGKRKKRKSKKWWTDECTNIVEDRRRLRMLAEQDSEKRDEYIEVSRKARQVIRTAKRKHMSDTIKNMESLIKMNEARKFYQEIRSAKKSYQPNVQFLEDDSGDLVTDSHEINKMWRQYFQNLLNCPPPVEGLHDRVLSLAESEEVEPLNFEEVRNAIMRLKNNKAPGIDDLPSELWKYGGGALQSRLFDLITRIWELEQQPTQWNTGVICPVHKKGSRKKCNNYRGIALLPTAYKILSYVLLSRLEPYSETIIGDYQCGFRRNRSTVDQIFVLKQLMEKKWEYAQSIHAVFVDFAKAYDSIDRPTLYRILSGFKIPQKLVRMVKVATSESRMTVRVGTTLTEEFDVITGLKQGDALSPMLFNLALEHVIREVYRLSGGVLLNGQHKVIGYADDLALLGERKEHVIDAVDCLQREASRIGLRINHEKTEYLLMRRYKNTRQKRDDLAVGDTKFKGVAKFRYLGCTVTDTNDREEEIEIRAQNTLRCSAALHSVLSSKLLSRRTKIRVYKTVVRPILMYGCEAWTLTQKEEAKLLITERKVLRKILGPVQRDDGSWRVRKNREVEELYGEPNVMGEVKAQRLRWLGHVERMEEDRAVKRAYLGVPKGRRPVGRPKYRWCDAVEGDLRELQVPDWREVAQRRDDWRVLLSEAKIHFGVIAPA